MRFLTLSALTVTLVALAGCSESATEPAPSTPTIPSPSADQTAQLLPALRQAAPALASISDDKLVTWSRNQCSTLQGGGDANASAAQRFGNGADRQISDEQATAINQAIKSAFCH